VNFYFDVLDIKKETLRSQLAWQRSTLAERKFDYHRRYTTDRLTADSSTTELLWININAWQRSTLAERKFDYHRR
ncbi:hypothetical protein AAGX82_13760, partial [Staphylococcus aureus]